ncbi:uncharacterized protein MCAP_0864-like isoform X1 [Centruroides vittatus]|uniref:uncharacterized protein MCAP_0864-like isoform X1 n=1 Tax=Centruroides vittatus TaxID=120091 RepID=UPI00350F77E5
MIQLEQYKKLEKDLDEISEKVNKDNVEDESVQSLAEKILIPSTLGKLQHNVNLFHKITELEKKISSLSQELSEEKKIKEKLQKDLVVANNLINFTKRPHSLVMDAVREKEIQIQQLREEILSLQKQKEELAEEYHKLENFNKNLSDEMKKILNNREELGKVKQLLITLHGEKQPSVEKEQKIIKIAQPDHASSRSAEELCKMEEHLESKLMTKIEFGRQIEEIKTNYKKEQKLLKNKIRTITDENEKMKEETEKLKNLIQNVNKELQMKYCNQIQKQKEENNQRRENIKNLKQTLEEKLIHFQKSNNEMKNRIVSHSKQIDKINDEKIFYQKKNRRLRAQLNRFRQGLMKVMKHIYDPPFILKTEIFNLLRDQAKWTAGNQLEMKGSEERCSEIKIQNLEIEGKLDACPEAETVCKNTIIENKDNISVWKMELSDFHDTRQKDEFSKLFHQIISVCIIPRKSEFFSSSESSPCINNSRVEETVLRENKEHNGCNWKSMAENNMAPVHMWSLQSPTEIFRILI